MKHFLFVCLTACCFLSPLSAEDAYTTVARRAEALSKAGNFKGAFEAYTEALELKPNDFKLWVNRGLSLLNLKKPDEAISDFNKALQLKPNDELALQARATCKSQIKDFNGALKDYNTLITLAPKKDEYLFERARAKHQSGDAIGATSDYNECIKRGHQKALSHYWLGMQQLDSKAFGKAAVAFKTALSLDKTLVDAYYRLAICDADKGDLSSALTSLNYAVNQSPNDQNYRLLRASLYLDTRAYTLAGQDARFVLTKQPVNTDARIMLIRVKNGLKDSEGAIHDIDSLLKKYPNGNEVLYMEQGKALFRLGKWNEAIESLDHSLLIKPLYLDALLERGKMFFERGNYRKAIADFNVAVENFSRNNLTWYYKGRALIGLELYDEALSAIEQGFSLSGDQVPEGYHFRGLLRFKEGDDQKALADYNQALTLDAAYDPARNELAYLLLKQGKYKEALETFNVVLSHDNRNVTASCGAGLANCFLAKYDIALKQFTQTLQLDNESAAAYYGRGITYVRMKRTNEALADLNKALDVSPDYPEALYERGLLIKEAGLPGNGCDDLKRAADLGHEQASKAHQTLCK